MNRKDIRHTGFNLRIENPALKQKLPADAPKPSRWLVVATGLPARDEAHKILSKEYPGAKYRIEGTRLDFTPVQASHKAVEESAES